MKDSQDLENTDPVFHLSDYRGRESGWRGGGGEYVTLNQKPPDEGLFSRTAG